MVYSDKDIIRAYQEGKIVIDPFVSENVKGSSLDLTLGQWFYTTEADKGYNYYNPYSKGAVERFFGQVKKAMPHQEWCKKHGLELFEGIAPNNPIIVLAPGERILAHTNEFVGIKPPGTTKMLARSSWGRNGISVCYDAGWGDPGYINRWTMEIYNNNQDHSVPLRVGERVAQMVFHQTGDVAQSYEKTGKYQACEDLDQLKRNWCPEMMLPQSYKDHLPWID